MGGKQQQDDNNFQCERDRWLLTYTSQVIYFKKLNEKTKKQTVIAYDSACLFLSVFLYYATVHVV